MAVYSYNITVDDVLAQYPDQDGVTITAVSRGLNFGVIEAFRDQGAAILNNALKRHGITPEQLDEDGSAQLRDAVIAYTIARCLLKLGEMDQSVLYMDIFKLALKTLRDMPQDLGDNQVADNQVHTSVPDQVWPAQDAAWGNPGGRWEW